MTQDDRMETITDPAEIRATSDERGCCDCRTFDQHERECILPDERTTPAPVGAAVALDLDAIEARANAATEGTWRADSHSHIQNGCRCLSCYDDPTVYQLSVFLDCEDVPRWDDDATRCTQSGFQTWADADFAAHAREDVPALVAEVRRLTESRATVAANLAASLLRAEAEVGTLRAKVAALQVAVSHSAESCADGPCEFHETVARAESAEAKVAAVEAVEDSWSRRTLPWPAWPHVHHWLRDLRAALAGTTGEGQ